MEIKDRIVQEASILFYRNGVRSMTMSDIANQLGISKRTLYEVFQDKEDLLEECINANRKKTEHEINNLINSSEDVIDALMRIYAKHLSDAQSINRSMLHDLRKYHAPIYRKVENQQHSAYYAFIELLKKGIQQDLIREDTNVEVMMWLVQAQFRALINDEVIPTDKYPIKEFIRVIILNSIRGVATPAGVAQIDHWIEKIKENKIKQL